MDVIVKGGDYSFPVEKKIGKVLASGVKEHGLYGFVLGVCNNVLSLVTSSESSTTITHCGTKGMDMPIFNVFPYEKKVLELCITIYT